MFKQFVVGLVTALFLTILISTPPASAASRYWDSSPTNWQFMETPGLDYGLHEGEITLGLIPLEDPVNGLDHSMGFQYGIMPGWEFSGQLDSRPNSLEGFFQVQHNLIQNPKLLLTGETNLTFGEGTIYDLFNNRISRYKYMIPGVQLLLAQRLSEEITLYTNAEVTHHGEIDFQLNLEQGIAYQLHPEHQINARILSQIDSVEQIRFNLKAAYRANLYDHVDYYFHLEKSIGESNLFYSNNLEVRPTDDLKLTGTFAYNTKPSLSNSLQLTAEKHLAPNMQVTTEISKSLRKHGYYGVRAGLRYTL